VHGLGLGSAAKILVRGITIWIHPNLNVLVLFDIIRVNGNYDESVAEVSRVAEDKGWISETSWPGYERTPRLRHAGLHRASE